LRGASRNSASPSHPAPNSVSSAPDGAALLVCPTKPGPTFQRLRERIIAVALIA
jgi:hypothetical protein